MSEVTRNVLRRYVLPSLPLAAGELVDALKGTPYEEQARALYKPPRKARAPKDPKDVKTKPAAGKVEKPSKKNKDKEAKKGKKTKKTGTEEASQ